MGKIATKTVDSEEMGCRRAREVELKCRIGSPKVYKVTGC